MQSHQQNLPTQGDSRNNSAAGSSSEGRLSAKQAVGAPENVSGGAFLNSLNRKALEMQKN